MAVLSLLLQDFSHTIYKSRKSLWMMESVSKLKDLLYAVKDVARRNVMVEVITEFKNRVLTRMESLEKGVIHGDVNDQNILVETITGEYVFKGILDFGDNQHSCYLFEIAIMLTYVLMLSKNLDVGAHLLAGYSTIRQIPEEELVLIKVRLKY